MKKIAAAAGAALLVAGAAVVAAPAAQAGEKCNWGQLTSEAIAGGFDQGGHASSFAGSPRVGLANIFGTGDLNATCEALS